MDGKRIDSVSQFPQLTQVLNKLYVVSVILRNMNDETNACSFAVLFLCIRSYHMNGSGTKCSFDSVIHGATVFGDRRVADKLALSIAKQYKLFNNRTDRYKFSSVEVLSLESAVRYLHRSMFVNTRWNDLIRSTCEDMNLRMDKPAPLDDDMSPTFDIPHIRPSKMEFSFASAGKNPSAVLDYVTSADGKPEEQDTFRTDELPMDDREWVDRHDGVTSTTKLS